MTTKNTFTLEQEQRIIAGVIQEFSNRASNNVNPHQLLGWADSITKQLKKLTESHKEEIEKVYSNTKKQVTLQVLGNQIVVADDTTDLKVFKIKKNDKSNSFQRRVAYYLNSNDMQVTNKDSFQWKGLLAH